jgi:hypothetical protein
MNNNELKTEEFSKETLQRILLDMNEKDLTFNKWANEIFRKILDDSDDLDEEGEIEEISE